MYINPNVYDSHIPPKLATKVPSLVKVIEGRKVTSAPWSRRVTLTSSGGQSFISFAKSSEYGKDIYSDLLTPHLRSNLLVQTWQNGNGGKIYSCCNGFYYVKNIKKMKLGSEVFSQSKDHSKWAVTASEGFKWICFGDNNRMESQKKKGGGILCFENESLHKYLRGGVTDLEECPESEQTLPSPRVTQPVSSSNHPQNIADTASLTDLFEAKVNICDDIDEEDLSTARAIQESLDQQNHRTGIDELDNGGKLVRLCQDLASRVSKTEEPKIVNIDRDSLLTSTLDLVNSEGFSFWRGIRVVFDGEEAEDKGGPRREFFKLLMKEVVNSFGVLQSNQQGESVFTGGLTSEKCKLAGQFVLWSVTHGGPGISALCSNVYSAMSGRPEQMSLDHIKCVTDHLIKSNLEKLMSCSNQAEFSSTMTDITDWPLAQGVARRIGVDFKDRDTLVKDLLKQQQLYRVQSCIQQFMEGLGQLGEEVRKQPEVVQSLFLYDVSPLALECLKSLYRVSWSPEGSNHQLKEQDTVNYWEAFLNNCAEEKIDVSLRQVLDFWTAAEKPPPGGFGHELEIQFYPVEEGERRLPSSSTCALILWLPRGIKDHDTFQEMMVFAINGTKGFGKI